MTQLAKAIQQLANTHLRDDVSVCIGEVTSVDVDARTCTVTTIGGNAVTDLVDVHLMAAVGDGLLVVPEIDSAVVVMWSKRMQPCVVMYSDIKEIYLTASNRITLNEGEFGGLVKVADLVDRLNKLEDAFNALNSKVNTLAPTPVILPLAPTVRAQIENPNVTHG